MGFIKKNAMKIDAAREYAETIKDSKDKDAVVFSIVLAMNKVFNNSNDQKSCFKEWMDKSKKISFSKNPHMSPANKDRFFW